MSAEFRLAAAVRAASGYDEGLPVVKEDRRRPGELRALTGARGIAAWFVVLFHIHRSIAHLPPLLTPLCARGYLAVDFFFLLSGFVMGLSWGQRLHERRWAAIGPFLRKRIARIWPLHVVMLAATVALALVLVAIGRADPVAFPFADLPLHLLLIQNWGFTDHLAWNVPSWSISAELGAYLVFPLVAITLDWQRLSTPALVATAGTLVIGQCVAIGASPGHPFDIMHFGLIRCVCEFIAGTIVCALWQRGGGRDAAAIGAVLLTAGWGIGLPETIAAPMLFACLLFLLAGAGPSHPLAHSIVHWLGNVSYATYLCHYPLWMACKLIVTRDDANVSLPLIALYVIMVLGCSAMLYRFVERPAQRWVERHGISPTPMRALP